MSRLSQQAFSVFCDEVVRDAVAKRDSLRAENETLEPLHQKLATVKVYFGENVLYEVNLLESDALQEDDGQFLSYSVANACAVPYEECYKLHVCVSGIPLNDETRPILTVLRDTEIPSAELVLHISEQIKVTGTLDLDFLDNTLENATFTLTKIQVLKCVVERVIPCDSAVRDSAARKAKSQPTP